MGFDSFRPVRGFGIPIRPNTDPNRRTLIVGSQAPVPSKFSLLNGFPVDFPTIADAMAAVPLRGKGPGGEANLGGPEETWTILVTPGVYEEEIRMKPNVILVGIGQSAVIFPPKQGWRSPDGPGARRAMVYLNHNTSVQNLVFGKRGMTSSDYVFWNRDRYNVGVKVEGTRRLGPSYFGVSDVWVWPYDNYGKTLLLEGDWHTALFTNVGSSSWESTGYDVQVRGQHGNADCHFMNCFFDALRIDEGEGGCMLIEDLYDVHVRGSLLRTSATDAYMNLVPNTTNQYLPVPGSCVCVRDNRWASEPADEDGTYAWLENTSLEVPGRDSKRALHLVGPHARCSWRNSSADSFEGDPAKLDRPRFV